MKRTVIAIAVALVAGPALAIMPTGNPPAAPGAGTPSAPADGRSRPGEGTTSFVPQDAAADTGLRRGTVQKVDAGNGSFQVYGRTVAFDPARVQVIGADGKPAPLSALKSGSQVRFMVDPTDKSRDRATVIYLQ